LAILCLDFNLLANEACVHEQEVSFLHCFFSTCGSKKQFDQVSNATTWQNPRSQPEKFPAKYFMPCLIGKCQCPSIQKIQKIKNSDMPGQSVI
jgi:hypothetical protein